MSHHVFNHDVFPLTSHPCRTVERVREQLTILYHPDPSPSHTFLDDDPLRQACAAYDGSYLCIDGYTPQRAQPKRE